MTTINISRRPSSIPIISTISAASFVMGSVMPMESPTVLREEIIIAKSKVEVTAALILEEPAAAPGPIPENEYYRNTVL